VFEWTEAANKAFEDLKAKFTTAPILTIFDPEKETTVEADASDFTIGTTISQKHPDGKRRPTAFYSRKLMPAELNYDIYDKELLAIVVVFE
jgi:hypothetical protein